MSTALVRAIPLNAENTLKQALAGFKDILSDEQKAAFSAVSAPQPSDVFSLTVEIEKQAGSRKARRLIGPRLTNILQAIQRFSTLIDPVVGGSQSIVAGSIWGSLKLALQLATSFSVYFDELSRLFMTIGRSCPRFQDFGALYPQSEGLQEALCEYFAAIVRLCTRTVLFSRKPIFKQFSASFLKPFESEFGHCQRDFERLSKAVADEVSLASKQAQEQEARLQAIERKQNSKHRALGSKFMHSTNTELEEFKSWRRKMFKSELLNKCSIYNHQTAWKQARKCGNTQWIIEHKGYKEWRESATCSLIWCSGIVGSGKTVASANVVENLLLSKGVARTAYFFCRHDEAESLKARTVIGSIIRQLLSSIDSDAIELTDSTTMDMPFDSDQLLELLLRHLESNSGYFILLDGLDECEENEVDALIDFLRQLMSSEYNIKIYCSSRPDVFQRIYKDLSITATIHMTEASSSIATYIEESLEDCLANDLLTLGDPRLILTIQNALSEGAQGMYLWVAFQIKAICAQPDDENIMATLSNLPKTLPETFDRILSRMFSNGQVNPEFSQTLFDLVAVTRRPLTLEELRECISVEPGETTWNKKKLPNDMIKSINDCGSLLIIDEEDLTVHFAHHSIKQHLCSTRKNLAFHNYHVDSEAADLRLGEICVTYLNMGIFETQLVKSEPSRSKSQEIDYPTAIIEASLPQSKLIGKVALLLLKNQKGLGKRDIGKQLQKITEESTREAGSRHFFLEYARTYWLHHTATIEPRGSGTYNLWCRIVDGQVSVVELPWKSQKWEFKSARFIEWLLDYKHTALLRRVFESSSPWNSDFLPIVGRIFVVGQSMLARRILDSEFIDSRIKAPLLFVIVAAGNLALLRLWARFTPHDFPRISVDTLAKYGVDCVPLLYEIRDNTLKTLKNRAALWDPLALAVALNKVDIVRVIIRNEDHLYGRFYEFRGNIVPYIREAACRNLETMMNLLIDNQHTSIGRDMKEGDVDQYGWTAMFYAVAADAQLVIEKLKQDGYSMAYISAELSTDMITRALQRKVNMVRRLLVRTKATKEDDAYTPPIYELGDPELDPRAFVKSLNPFPIELPSDSVENYRALEYSTKEPKLTDSAKKYLEAHGPSSLADGLERRFSAYARRLTPEEHSHALRSTEKSLHPTILNHQLHQPTEADPSFQPEPTLNQTPYRPGENTANGGVSSHSSYRQPNVNATIDPGNATFGFRPPQPAAAQPAPPYVDPGHGWYNSQGVYGLQDGLRKSTVNAMPTSQPFLPGMFIVPMQYGNLSGVFLAPMNYGAQPTLANFNPMQNTGSNAQNDLSQSRDYGPPAQAAFTGSTFQQPFHSTGVVNEPWQASGATYNHAGLTQANFAGPMPYAGQGTSINESARLPRSSGTGWQNDTNVNGADQNISADDGTRSDLHSPTASSGQLGSACSVPSLNRSVTSILQTPEAVYPALFANDTHLAGSSANALRPSDIPLPESVLPSPVSSRHTVHPTASNAAKSPSSRSRFSSNRLAPQNSKSSASSAVSQPSPEVDFGSLIGYPPHDLSGVPELWLDRSPSGKS